MPVDLLCFSHLRWDFVYQRPNHLMARAAKGRRVFFIEEPVDLPADGRPPRPRLDRTVREGVRVVVPRLPAEAADDRVAMLRELLDDLVDAERIEDPLRWYYTPMALPWSAHIRAAAVVYDCMDDLSGFRDPPHGLLELEDRLIRSADLLFTGGRGLYETKGARHPDRHFFPSSVDRRHFARARAPQADPADQAAIGHPRLGYFGVIDERMDMELVAQVAKSHPDWHIVLVGPIAKIDDADVPASPNIHRLGPRPYAQLPAYLAGWDVAIMPFAHNSATRFISPTKTPEYLAGGRPVASTAIADVVDPYGRLGLVELGDGADGFADAVTRALATDRGELQRRADHFLDGMSWDRTWTAMSALIDQVIARNRTKRAPTKARAEAPVAALAGASARSAGSTVMTGWGASRDPDGI